MLIRPNIDPVAIGIPPIRIPFTGIEVGPLSIHWYGLMYGLAFIIGFYVIRAVARNKKLDLMDEQLNDLVTHLMFGVILGGRLGYVLFYGLADYLRNPLEIFAVWHGGMSFHGGAIGTAIAGWLFCRKHGFRFLAIADSVMVAAPIGLGLGRLGNFINAELWGRPSGVPWAMVFPTDPLRLPRHPSQLYELALEGILLFLIMWFYSRRKPPDGAALGLFLTCYGVFRCFVEFFRTPDAQLGFIWGPFSMGQFLSLPMVLLGVGLMVWSYRSRKVQPLAEPLDSCADARGSD